MRKNWTLASASNNPDLLEKCLLSSPGAKHASEIIIKTGYSSATEAYNKVIAEAKTDIIVFAHQDVYLPPTWQSDLERAISNIENLHSKWGVAGPWGVDEIRQGHGHLYCTGNGICLGQRFDSPIKVQTLDECILILNKKTGLKFDTLLDDWHLYGTDICMTAQNQGLGCFAISAYVLHNTNSYKLLPSGFWTSYNYLRNKWKKELPIHTPCIRIDNSPLKRIRDTLGRLRANGLSNPPQRRSNDPNRFYEEVASKFH